jgi:CheY-like chemotaxis protein
MLSSAAADETQPSWRQAEIEALLTKPVRQSTLYNCLVGLLASAPRTVPSPTLKDSVDRTVRLAARVLLVEDNAVNQDVAAAMVRELGCTTDVADNGCAALELMARQHYDAVLMDCQMPVMDGFVATAEIRRRERDGGYKRPIPVIALTADAFAGDRERCLDAGMSDYLAKPFTCVS